MENDILFDEIINTPSAILWNIIPPYSHEEYIEIAEAFKYLEGYPETFFAWSHAVTNFSMNRSEWDKIPLKITKKMEIEFKKSQEIEEEISNVFNLPVEFPLDIKFADQLPEKFEAPDEIVEGLLTAGDGSILYGDSNSGKTYFVVDMCCSVARGVNFLGRRVEKGMVVYLAVESPASVERRLQAYQQFYNVKVPNFCIVRNPINLFSAEDDTSKIIQLIKILESTYKEKVRLVVGDTLARLSSGANENAGTDMGVVVKHFDKIRRECGTHFLLIHHCGKNAAAGARGWSGVRAAMDTEIEITENSDIKCAEITKQRDLGTKGIRIGFKTSPIEVGKNKWDEAIFSCVVVSTDPPSKISSKKSSEIKGALIEYFLNNKKLIRRADVVKHFSDRHSRSALYSAVDILLKDQKIKEENGFIEYIF